MLMSMTGYGKGEAEEFGIKVTAEIRGINHRYLEIGIKSKRFCGYIDDPIRKRVATVAKRGKIDIILMIEYTGAEYNEVEPNIPLAMSYYNSINQIKEALQLERIDYSAIIGFSEVFKVQKEQPCDEELYKVVMQAVDVALLGFGEMRQAEGMALRKDLCENMEDCHTIVDKIKEHMPQVVEEYRTRLTQRIGEVLGNIEIDKERLLMEVAVFAERIDVNEELVRLSSHLAQMKRLMNAGGSLGKKLDFIIQELNREANTIGSKSNNAVVSHLVVDLKSAIEKMREQAQNIE